jgi:putative flippase GtrA
MLLKNNILKILHKFTKYFVGAWLFFLFYMFLLRGFTDIAGINYLLSAICAFTITAIGWFIFQKNVTFKNKNRHNIKQMSLFTMFLLIWLCFDLSFLKIWVWYLWFHYLYVAIVSKGITFLRNFIMNYFFTFK